MGKLRVVGAAVARFRNWIGPWWFVFLVGLASYSIGRRVGKWQAPLVEQSRSHTATASSSTSMSHKSTNEAINWSLVDDAYQSADVSYYPNGAVKRVRTKARQRQEQKGAVTVTKVETVYVDKHHYHVQTVEKLVVREPSLPRWSIGAVGGYDYDGKRVYGGTAEVRVGPAWVGAIGTNKAAMLSLRWGW